MSIRVVQASITVQYDYILYCICDRLIISGSPPTSCLPGFRLDWTMAKSVRSDGRRALIGAEAPSTLGRSQLGPRDQESSETRPSKGMSWEDQLRTRNSEMVERTVPEAALQLKTGEVEKLCANDDWQVPPPSPIVFALKSHIHVGQEQEQEQEQEQRIRRIVVSAKSLMITRPDSDMFIDSIPLHEVERISIIEKAESHEEDETRKSRHFTKTKASPSPISFHTQYKQPGRRPSVSEESVPASDAEYRMFQVVTPAGGFNSGRTYYFRAETLSASEDWIRELKRMVKEAKRAHDRLSRMVNLQNKVRRIYVSTPTQTVVALLILGNFVLSAYETQLNPQTQNGLDTFKRIDLVFTILFTIWALSLSLHANAALSHIIRVFHIILLHTDTPGLSHALSLAHSKLLLTFSPPHLNPLSVPRPPSRHWQIELTVNLFAHWLRPFVADGWNFFDVCVVTGASSSELIAASRIAQGSSFILCGKRYVLLGADMRDHDGAVVAASILSILLETASGIKGLRMMRGDKHIIKSSWRQFESRFKYDARV
eukprot:3836912-Rhodomonas_salina.3